jgi:hypothetical protein
MNFFDQIIAKANESDDLLLDKPRPIRYIILPPKPRPVRRYAAATDSKTSPVKRCSVVKGCNVYSCLHEQAGCRILGCNGTCQRCKDWKLRD